MRKRNAVLFMMVFVLGWISSGLIGPVFVLDREQPLSFALSFNSAQERSSPSDHILEREIHVYDDRIVLDIEDAIFAKYSDTNSMDPILDENSNGLEIMPDSPSDISVGDVISYHSEYRSGILVHRVIKKGVDEDGVYFIVKGDNNPGADPGKIRFSQIHGMLVGIIY